MQNMCYNDTILQEECFMKRKICILSVIIIALVIMTVKFLTPFDCTDPTATDSTDTVTVTDNGDVCFIDGAGDDALLIFYPGARVEYTSYCALFKELAEKGVDCCIVRMPLNMAFLGADKASEIIADSTYDKIYIGGHSLGGVSASAFASKHSDALEGILFLASYPTSDLSKTSLRALTVIGELDGVVPLEAIDKRAANAPAESELVIIEGGNHAQFGTYGAQPADNAAAISAEAQREKAAEAIADFILSGE